MNTKPTKKQWTRGEWLLLLAPLVIVVGIGAMNFAPQLGRAWREWREYGNARPYVVFWAVTRSSKSDLTFYPVVFSADGKHLVGCEHEATVGKNSRVSIWDVNSLQQVSSWGLSGLEPSVESLQFVLPNKLNVGIRDYTPFPKTAQFYVEKRNIENGKLVSTRKMQKLSYRTEPTLLHSVTLFSSYKGSEPQLEKLGKTKNSVKLFAVKTPINVDSSFMTDEDKKFAVQWMAQVFDAQGRKLRKPFPLLKCFDRSNSRGTSGSSMQFNVSPDGKTLLIKPRTSDFLAQGIFQESSEWLEAFDTTTGHSLWKRVLTQPGTQNDLLKATTFSPKSNVAAFFISQHRGGAFQNNLLEVRNTRTGSVLGLLNTYSAAESRLAGVYMQFSPDGKLLAVPQDDRLELWDVSDLN